MALRLAELTFPLYREALAKFLNLPQRADWKQCTTSAAQQKQDVQAFKKIYNSFK
jgi:hypothetical protein